MRNFGMLSVANSTISGNAAARGGGAALGQTAEDLVGTWTWLSIDLVHRDGNRAQPFGPHANGLNILEANGYFAYLLTHPGWPKFTSSNGSVP